MRKWISLNLEQNYILEMRKLEREEGWMIIKIVHIRTADSDDFVGKLRIEVAKMQNECGLDVEVQYQIGTMEDGYNQYIVYSALVIGRDKGGVE